MLLVNWSRAKRQFQTKPVHVKPGTALSVMNELFEINTVLEIDAQTGLPTKEKMADLTVIMKDDKTVIG